MSSARELVFPLILLAAASLACGHTVSERTAYWLPTDANLEARRCVGDCEAQFATGSGPEGARSARLARCLERCPGVLASVAGRCAEPDASAWCQELVVSTFEVDDGVTTALLEGVVELALSSPRSSREDREEDARDDTTAEEEPRRQRLRGTPAAEPGASRAPAAERRPATPRAGP